MDALKHSLRMCILTAIIMLNVIHQSAAETIDVTNKDGQTISARLVRYDGKDVVIFRVSDSKTFTIPIDTLDDKTRTKIELWIKKGGNLVEDYDVSVKTGKSLRTTGVDDFDDKRVNLKPVVSVKNPHSTMESKSTQITILFLGRPVNSRTSIYVFRTQTFDIPKLEALGSKDFRVNPISKPYDNRGYAKFGSRYMGYVWVIHNKLKTEFVASGSVPSSLTDKALLNFLEMKSGRYYSKDLLPIESNRGYHTSG